MDGSARNGHAKCEPPIYRAKPFSAPTPNAQLEQKLSHLVHAGLKLLLNDICLPQSDSYTAI